MHRARLGSAARVPVVLLLTVTLSLLVAACGASDGPGATGTPSGAPTATVPADEATPAPTTATGEPVTPEPTVAPTTEPTPTDGEPTAAPTAAPTDGSPSGDPGGAAACAGTDDNRDFYVKVAQAVDWTVLCPVLPGGWFVDAGSYRLAGGGQVTISYRGPGGARLELREGAFCAELSGCVPDGDEVGEAAFGPFDGTLVATDVDAWAIVVDQGATISWLLVVSGFDEAGVRDVAAALVEVAG